MDSESTAQALAAIREMYRPAAARATLVYFVVSDLATVDPMYTISLPYYMTLFNRTLQVCSQHNAVIEHCLPLPLSTTGHTRSIIA